MPRANYQPHLLLRDAITRKLTHFGFAYPGQLGPYLVQINVELNDDDIEVIMSENVIYCYLILKNLDYYIKPTDALLHNIENLGDILKTAKFIPKTSKVWRADGLLYLLKINLNSGVISRYDPTSSTFSAQNMHWKVATIDEIIDNLLNESYLQDYLSEELSTIASPVGFATRDTFMLKETLETIRKS